MFRFARRGAIVCIAAAITASAADKDPWIKVTSASFELYTTAVRIEYQTLAAQADTAEVVRSIEFH